MRVGFLAMTALLLAGGLVTILYMQRVTARLLTENVTGLQAAQDLEVALFRMRGLTASYLLDGDPRWLRDLEERKHDFLASFEQAKATAGSPQDEEILRSLVARFTEYESGVQPDGECTWKFTVYRFQRREQGIIQEILGEVRVSGDGTHVLGW